MKDFSEHQLVRYFFGLHPSDVAEAVSHWMHTPDCSPQARKLIQDASFLDGRTKNYETTFLCSTCCDSKRISDGKGSWISCPNCE